MACVFKLKPTTAESNILDELLSAALFITFGTTVVTTILIAYRIYSVVRQDGVDNSKRRFVHVLEVLIQSSAAYSLASFVNAVSGIIPFNGAVTNSMPLIALQYYMGPIFCFAAVSIPD
jgi:hypothetical protein